MDGLAQSALDHRAYTSHVCAQRVFGYLHFDGCNCGHGHDSSYSKVILTSSNIKETSTQQPQCRPQACPRSKGNAVASSRKAYNNRHKCSLHESSQVSGVYCTEQQARAEQLHRCMPPAHRVIAVLYGVSKRKLLGCSATYLFGPCSRSRDKANTFHKEKCCVRCRSC
jgi:hypothetical protein